MQVYICKFSYIELAASLIQIWRHINLKRVQLWKRLFAAILRGRLKFKFAEFCLPLCLVHVNALDHVKLSSSLLVLVGGCQLSLEDILRYSHILSLIRFCFVCIFPSFYDGSHPVLLLVRQKLLVGGMELNLRQIQLDIEEHRLLLRGCLSSKSAHF